jgi:hypothetical protein
MGSTGTGKFSDYPGSSGGRPGGGGDGGGKGGGGGGGKPDKEDKCGAAIPGLSLDDVGASEYFTTHKGVPPVRTKVQVRKRLVGGRIAVETVSSSEVIGYVPTGYNYLRGCMSNGWEYAGTVVDSSSGKLPKVKVNLTASK